MAAAASSRGGTMEIEKLSVEQLRGLKEQADLEVNLLQDSLTNIRTATVRLELASSALNDLSSRPQGKKMLVPLTASLYVPGNLDDADKVLVDVGTGYFIEKTMAEGRDYCERKISLLKSNHEQLLESRIQNLTLSGAILGAEENQPCPDFGIKVDFDHMPYTRSFSANLELQVAAKKKSIADEAGALLQARLKNLTPAQ